MLAPKSNPLLAVEELCFVKQGSINSGEFYAHITHIQDCEKMQISQHHGRRKSHQGHHILRHEQYKGNGQGHQVDE